jgi:hypothetical protein
MSEEGLKGEEEARWRRARRLRSDHLRRDAALEAAVGAARVI